MLDGIYFDPIDESETYSIVRKTIYKSGVKVYENIIIVDKKSDLSEEFKEKLKEHQE